MIFESHGHEIRLPKSTAGQNRTSVTTLYVPKPLYEKALAIAPNSIRALYNFGNLDLLENRPVQALASFRQLESKSGD